MYRGYLSLEKVRSRLFQPLVSLALAVLVRMLWLLSVLAASFSLVHGCDPWRCDPSPERVQNLYVPALAAT